VTLDVRGVRSVCPSCNATIRQLYGTLDRTTRCGKCRTPLPAPAAPIEVSDISSFDALLANASIPVVVDFWAPWCAPCRTMAPELATMAHRTAGRVLVVKVDTEELPVLGGRFGIRSIPTVALFRQGQEAARVAGARPAADLERFALTGKG
jgi:thioredoxin 2